MKKTFFLFISTFIIACNAEDKKKATDEIASLYKANVSLVKGVSNNSKNGSSKYLKVNITNSDAIKSSKIEPELAATNSAIIILNSLKDASLYQEYIIEIEDAGLEVKLSKDKLAKASQNYTVLSNWLYLIVNKKYEDAYKQLTEHAQTVIPIDHFNSTWLNLNKKNGKVIDAKIVGFYTEEIETDSTDITMYNYRTIFYTDQNNNFSMDIFMSDRNLQNNIFGLILRKD